MNFSVRDWMVDTIVFIDPDATLTEALMAMRRRYMHSVIVKKTGSSDYGIITSTDISDHVIASGQNPRNLHAREVMHSPLITINANLSLKECAMKMKEHHIHHMPVVNDKGDLVGMISATDFLVAAEAMTNEE